jgi:acetate kinase
VQALSRSGRDPVFVYRIVRKTGSLCAALGGLDALVFTAGIGERAQPVRARDALRWLSVELDAPTPAGRIARASPH